MKSRLGASMSLVFTDQSKKRIFKAISVIRKLPLISCDGQTETNSLQLRGNESFKRLFHSSSDEDDEFSELGPPAAQGAGTLLKLMTEKRDHFTPKRKSDHARKLSSGRALPEESSLIVKDIFGNRGTHVPAPHLKTENDNDASRLTSNRKSTSNLEISSSISIENIPSAVSLSQLIEAISIFGKISSASMRTVLNDLDCCDVAFESVESSRRAISVGGIRVRSFHLPICPLNVSETVAFRIMNISGETTEPAIHSKCVSVGSLEGISRAKRDAVDAFYRVKDNLDSKSILKKLNDTVIDNCRWSANLLPRDSGPVSMANTVDDKSKLGLQIGSHLEGLRRQFEMKKIYAEDLKHLHIAIEHLECHPVVSGDASSVG